jgi:hypothetical protein
LLSVGTAIKAFPVFLYPALARGERRLRRVVVAGAIPLLLCAAAVLIAGDEFGSAISYHTDRPLQVESLGASFYELAHVLGASGISSAVGHGGFEIRATGATAVRWLSVVLGAGLYLWIVWAGWRSRVPNLRLVTTLLAVLVVFSPVLSPQFLLWILPISACAYGLGKENVVLLLAILFTQIALQHYDGVDSLSSSFVWPLAARNGYLVVYLWLVAAPIVRAGGAGRHQHAEEPRDVEVEPVLEGELDRDDHGGRQSADLYQVPPPWDQGQGGRSRQRPDHQQGLEGLQP